MNRLPPLPLPRARGAGKARFFAAVGLMVALVAFLARRFDLVDTGTLVVSVALAVLCALVALLCVGLTIADIWRGQLTPDYLKEIVNTNEHAPDQFRAIGAPSNMPAFAAAFLC